MSSFRERLANAVDVWLSDPDEVVMFKEDDEGRVWTYYPEGIGSAPSLGAALGGAVGRYTLTEGDGLTARLHKELLIDGENSALDVFRKDPDALLIINHDGDSAHVRTRGVTKVETVTEAITALPPTPDDATRERIEEEKERLENLDPSELRDRLNGVSEDTDDGE